MSAYAKADYIGKSNPKIILYPELSLSEAASSELFPNLHTKNKNSHTNGEGYKWDNELVGVVTKKDIFKLTGVKDLSELTEDKLERLKTIKVSDVVKKPLTLFYKRGKRKNARMLKKYPISKLIIVDKNKKMIGVISKTGLVDDNSKRKRLTTTIDEVLEAIKNYRSISIEDIAKKFMIDKSLAERWIKILEEHKFVTANYPLVGKPYVTSNNGFY